MSYLENCDKEILGQDVCCPVVALLPSMYWGLSSSMTGESRSWQVFHEMTEGFWTLFQRIPPTPGQRSLTSRHSADCRHVQNKPQLNWPMTRKGYPKIGKGLPLFYGFFLFGSCCKPLIVDLSYSATEVWFRFISSYRWKDFCKSSLQPLSLQMLADEYVSDRERGRAHNHP